MITTYLGEWGGCYPTSSLHINSVELLSTHGGLFVSKSPNGAIKTHLSLCVKPCYVPVFMGVSQYIVCLDNSYKAYDHKSALIVSWLP